VSRITQVRTRDGRVVPFDLRRVADAIYRASRSAGADDRFLAEELAGVVVLYLERGAGGRIPAVADVATTVERVLVDTGHAAAARAYAAQRERRRAAREGVLVEVDGDDREGERTLPLVGGESGGPVRAWSRERIAAALVDEAGVDPATALDVARAVEERVLVRGVPRIGSSLVRALVDAELFDRGHVALRDRQRVVGLPKSDLGRRLGAVAADRRAADPAALAESVGELVLRQHVLEEEIPAEAAEAHRLGDLHLADLGTPLSARHVTLSVEALLARHLRGDGVPRALGPRRFGAALGEAALLHGAAASRTFTLEDVNVYLAPFVDRLEEDALQLEARELLLSPAFLAFPRRGGLLRLEWVLTAEVPHRLAAREALPPAPPGRTLSEYDDASLRAGKAILLAAAELRREGAGARLPDLTVVVPRGGPRDAATRSFLQVALGLASEIGEPVFVFDGAGTPSRGGRAQRASSADVPDPLRHERGDVTVASLGSVNLVAAALRAGPDRVDAFLEDVDRLAVLAVASAAARRGLLVRGGASPDGSLWGVRRGVEPLLDPDGALHVIEPVGLDRALEVLAAGDAEARADLAARIAHRLRVRVADEARRHDLPVVVAEVGDPEAARRFASTDIERFETVRASFGDDEDPTYRRTVELGEGRFVEPSGLVSPRGGGPRRRVRLRIEGDRRPSVDALYAGLEASAADARVLEHVLDPWPRRWVRPV
jgi:ribonucleoside-triphosphate reductase